MSFRKHGTADDQRVALDREEDERDSRTASARPGVQWTEEDREALLKESAE